MPERASERGEAFSPAPWDEARALVAAAIRALAARWLGSGFLRVMGPSDQSLATDHGAMWQEFAAARDRFVAGLAAPGSAAADAPLGHLVRAGVLDGDDALLLVLAAAPCIDGETGRAYGRLLGRDGFVAADVALLLELAERDPRRRLDLRFRLTPESPLCALDLLLLEGDGPLPSRRSIVPEEVVAVLTGQAPRRAAGARLESVLLPVDVLESALAALDGAVAAADGSVTSAVVVAAAPGTGRRSLLRALAGELERSTIDVTYSDEDEARPLRRGVRDALLGGSLLIIELPASHAVVLPPAAVAALRLAPLPLLVATPLRTPPPPWLGAARVVVLPAPSAEVRRQLWTASLGDGSAAAEDITLVADRYHLLPAQIGRAAARIIAGGQPAGVATLLDAARAELTHSLGDVAERIEARGSWADLVLPDEILRRLGEIPLRVQQSRRVYEEWGFGGQAGVPPGITALFAGPPGTGKTLCAGVIAGELGLELYRIDLSQIVSKWVGETEKNLARVFDEAAASRAVILFDEADALFGKRTDVKSSSDRYANMEVNFLLQRIETYEGIALLTTNFQQAVDEAFRRRLQFRIEFPFPDDAARVHLWRKLIPRQALLSCDIDFAELAERFPLSGGNIRNATVAAAFAAADRGTAITHDLLIDAAQLEMEELGKLTPR